MITARHIDVMCKIILLTGTIVGYAYIMEFFIAWYGGNPYEIWAFLRCRVAGPVTDVIAWAVTKAGHPDAFPKLPWAPYWWAYYCMMSFNVISPQLFWFRFCRRNLWVVFAVCMCVNAGMWFERFVIIVTSIARDFLPSSWGMFHPTWVDMWTFAGTFGLFLTLFLLFIRFLPMIAIAEVKGVTPFADAHTGHGVATGYAGGATPEPVHLMPGGVGSGTRARSTDGGAVPATSEHPAEPIRPDAANQGRK